VHVLPSIFRTTLPCESAGKSTSTVRTRSLVSVLESRVTTTCTESSRTIEPDTGNGFRLRGRFQVTALTLSCDASVMLRELAPSENSVVSCPTETAECVRDFSTGGTDVSKLRTSVSLEGRCCDVAAAGGETDRHDGCDACE